MALPDPLSFTVQIKSVIARGPDPATGKFRFTYTFERTTTPNGNTAVFSADVLQDTADQYPCGQILTLTFDIP